MSSNLQSCTFVLSNSHHELSVALEEGRELYSVQALRPRKEGDWFVVVVSKSSWAIPQGGFGEMYNRCK
jgi:hypothetical protein